MDKTSAYLHYLTPKRALTALMYRATRIRWAWYKDRQIRWFIRRYGVDMAEAKEPDPTRYLDFNEFFTRELCEHLRPVAPGADTLVSPADGTISALGTVDEGTLIQAKGYSYALRSLLDGDAALARELDGGLFITVYLSPRDYHRVHAPVNARIARVRYVPGTLFSVNQATVNAIPRIFARNERAIFELEHDGARLVLLMIGALCVSGIETPWCGPVSGKRALEPQGCPDPHSSTLRKGDELARFTMGSTVILVLPKAYVEWQPGLQVGGSVRMGQALGQIAARGANPGGGVDSRGAGESGYLSA